MAARFRVEATIGRGGAGTVYRARRLDNDEAIALKVMHDRDASGVELQRFEREAKAAQRLRHDNAVRIFELGYLDDGRPFIVYELLRGRSLKLALKRHGAMGALRAARITYEMLDALVFAHSVGIVHRDIKPANIFLAQVVSQPGGEPTEVSKLLDLGLATEPDGEQGAVLTLTGHRLGTPRYMSPEMARGQCVGPASDLYSLALVAAEMVTGRAVLSQKMQIELLMAHAGEQPHVLQPEVLASPLGAPIERALAKDLSVRYRTAVQMRADVEAVLQQLQQRGDGADPPMASADLAPTMMMSVASLDAQARAAGYAPPAPNASGASGGAASVPTGGQAAAEEPARTGHADRSNTAAATSSKAVLVAPAAAEEPARTGHADRSNTAAATSSNRAAGDSSAAAPKATISRGKSPPNVWLMVTALVVLALLAGALGYLIG